MTARKRLIVALDVPTAEAAAEVASKLRGHIGMFKVGSELFCAEGPAFARNFVTLSLIHISEPTRPL